VNTSGTREYYSSFAIFSPVSVRAGDKIIIGNINVNSGVCPLAFNLDGHINSDMTSTPMAVYEAGKTSYVAVAPQDGYFIISNDKTKTPSVEIAKLLDISEIKQIGSLLSGKITMLFGDSLTAGSTSGVVAFAHVIANVLGIPYRAFVYDRFDPSPDTNSADVDIDIPSITNYGKDGTKNQITIGRVDSVLQRVKNHISADTIVDYVLIECCVNDYTSGTKGTISDSYTGPFDENTAIGAIEETCRYLSTLGKNLRFGFYIPWKILYVPEDYFNDYIPVFEKWGVPLFDMRKCAGFDMRNCVRHQELYSLPASSYANYDNTATYNLDDKVKYEGFLYKCNADGVTGILPTNETYWTKVSEGNFDGCHLNSLGHYNVAGKIQSFIERL
jgi:lysophospholipase L1-like esterase